MRRSLSVKLAFLGWNSRISLFDGLYLRTRVTKQKKKEKKEKSVSPTVGLPVRIGIQ